ncbi:MAG: DUF2520 domain-containing protein [Prevotella sp.]|jgi:predicted short-subunit dehydrogenase-like oxidoreductase (DUF2520 family)|nr:DUF2520 domain-containing protein [Prevotella sp.]
MRIVLIGTGRLGTNLAPALRDAGHEVTVVRGRALDDLPSEADAFIIAVKDDVLGDVIARATEGRENQLFLHTAGSMPMSVFEGRCRHYGVFYPMQTFSKETLVPFADIPLFLEADCEQTMATLQSLAESLSHSVYQLSSADRKYLHLAAVFACNFANHCMALSADVLAHIGIPFDVMMPLVDQTVRKLHSIPPAEAQTGPAVRYDENVIRRQHDLLADNPEMQRIYDLLTESIHKKTMNND